MGLNGHGMCRTGRVFPRLRTALPSPEDFSEPGLPLEAAKYRVAPRPSLSCFDAEEAENHLRGIEQSSGFCEAFDVS